MSHCWLRRWTRHMPHENAMAAPASTICGGVSRFQIGVHGVPGVAWASRP